MVESEPAALESMPEKGRSAGRHSAREVALQVLYAIDLASDESEPTCDAREAPKTGLDPGTASRSLAVFDRIVENFVVPSSAADFARELVLAVVERTDKLDTLLGIHAKNWRVTRMAAVDRNVLRLAVYELCDTETPVAVVIDEAVDLARRFGADSSPAFVNGVLDAVAREVRSA